MLDILGMLPKFIHEFDGIFLEQSHVKKKRESFSDWPNIPAKNSRKNGALW